MKKSQGGKLDRRAFLGQGSSLALGLLASGSAGLHAEELVAPELPSDEETPGPPVGCAVIGLGPQGRAILRALTHAPGAQIIYVCDSYARAHKRALGIAANAAPVEDFRRVLDDADVRAVWVTTPSHLHRDIAVAALQAGKHVYCEAPLASHIEDAKAIAQTALQSPKLVFQAGLQRRSHPLSRSVLGFIRTGAPGRRVQMRSQWHKKNSWRRAAPTPEREEALNWRLSAETSGGLMAEVGIHQLDVGNWFLKSHPVSVTGFGGILAWRDGRDVPDTVQCLFEYPNAFHLLYDATLGSSFDGMYDLYQGRDATILLRDDRAWMFKEADAPSLGWEVYATKEKIGDETGIALVADATKLLAEGKKPGEHRERDPKKTPLYYACAAFLKAVREGTESECGAAEGYQATVIALKANEAVTTASRIVFEEEWLDPTRRV